VPLLSLGQGGLLGAAHARPDNRSRKRPANWVLSAERLIGEGSADAEVTTLPAGLVVVGIRDLLTYQRGWAAASMDMVNQAGEEADLHQ
jgi:hypothetical protein